MTTVERSTTDLSEPAPTFRSLILGPGARGLLTRLGACVFGGLVLALMVGPQEGTLTDFGVSFRDAVLKPRVFVFIAIGVVIFLLVTLWPLVRPYIRRPGMVPLGAGILTVLISQTIMNWYDPLSANGSAKFDALAKAVSKTPAVSGLSSAFFAWMAWTLLGVLIVGVAVAILTHVRIIGWVTAAVGVFAAIAAYLAHTDAVNAGAPDIDHSLGMYADIIGFLVLAGAAITAVHSRVETADPRAFMKTVNDFRPGLVIAVIATIFGVFAFTSDGWFGALQGSVNLNVSTAESQFHASGFSGTSETYLSWLGYALFAVAAAGALAACQLCNRVLAWFAGVVSIAGVVLTFFTVKDMTYFGAKVASQYGAPWQNLGTGGFAACLAFSGLLGATVAVILAQRRRAPATVEGVDTGKGPNTKMPVGAMVERIKSSNSTKALLVVGMGVALFYPPTLPVTWQNVLVGQIGVYVLLAIGLNVVVGWAGLLDLGYIAFYEIGAYTTAYFTGSLQNAKPPSWLTLTPLQSIPFAVAACLIAGVLLGAPTLRLRGDYLAIVTLGFGEIIQLIAINWRSFTGGPIGPNVPHPTFKIIGLNITWGEDNLPYWYLLLIMLVIVLVLFYRLERSRIGRAWAAIREDEVAAQSSGVNVTRTKLLAFAIGASTSGLAGTFFASQVGYFDPSLFTLQASILIVAYVVFGGMGSLPGAMAGAAVLTWLPQFLKDQVPAEDRQMWVGALVLAMMIFRPAGLLPARRRKAELEGLDHTTSSETRAVPASEGL